MTRGIWNDPERYIEAYWSRFQGWWYHGDWASVDEQARGILTSHQYALWQLGVAHNKFGGSRKDQELQAIYRRVMEKTGR